MRIGMQMYMGKYTIRYGSPALVLWKRQIKPGMLRPDTYRELSGDGVKTNVDGVLKVRGGGDLGPVLVPVLLPASCR